MTGGGRTYWLSLHVPYACRHAGACCSSGWPIPIERARVDAVALLRPAGAWLRPVSGAPAEVAGVLAQSASGRCVFRGERCDIHGTLGHAALPSACQHFPRRVRLDPRGVFVTLSHYCPTAAELLFTHQGRVEIVAGPSVRASGEPEGLDARDVLPPLLREGTGHENAGSRRAAATRHADQGTGRENTGLRHESRRHAPVLMDWEGYAAWEWYMVDALANGGVRPEAALMQMWRNLREIQCWQPGRESLSACIARVRRGQATNREFYRPISQDDAVIGRFLAARAFASWQAFDRNGIEAVLTQLQHALEVLRAHQLQIPLKEAIRETDLELLHRADRV